MIRLVINADDYGIAENQTEAILESFRRGVITSTTIMVTMPDFRRSISRAKEEGVFDKIGLHLNLTQGRPLTEPIRNCRRFCNSEGLFNKYFHNSKLCRLILTAREQYAVAVEVESQMKIYIDAGFTLRHLDSHHHSHTDLSIAHIILPIARKMGFRSVRLSRNIPRPGYGLLKKIYKSLFNGFALRQGFTCTKYFGSILDFDVAATNLPVDCSVELMVHPSFQKNGQLVLSGELMDMHDPMKNVQEVLSRHSSRYRLVSYMCIH